MNREAGGWARAYGFSTLLASVEGGSTWRSKTGTCFSMGAIPDTIEVDVNSSRQKNQDIEWLARMAARVAGRDPDERVKIEFAGIVAFAGEVWRYPDFLTRAEAAYHVLELQVLSSHH